MKYYVYLEGHEHTLAIKNSKKDVKIFIINKIINWLLENQENLLHEEAFFKIKNKKEESTIQPLDEIGMPCRFEIIRK